MWTLAVLQAKGASGLTVTQGAAEAAPVAPKSG